MTKSINRNILKVTALIAMLVDHIGLVFFPNIIILRIIGRIAFPIFAFFIAEGYKHTKNKPKYTLTILAFAIISYGPYCLFVGSWFKLNILFTFAFSIALMFLFDKSIEDKKNNFIYIGCLVLTLLLVIVLDLFKVIEYGLFGVLTAFALYIYRENKLLKYIVLATILSLLSVSYIPFGSAIVFTNFIQFFSLLSIPVLFLYNGKAGRLNLKYMFYIFYPAHLLILVYLIKIMFFKTP